MTQAEPRRVIVGDDGSPGADTAWRFVIDQRWDGGWAIDVVHVAPRGPAEEPPPRRRAPQGLGVPVTATLREGDPRVVLGHESEGSLLVVGRTGGGFAARWLHLGGTSGALVDRARLPVIVSSRAGPVREVIVTADGSAAATFATEVFASLPWAVRTTVLAVGVYDGWSDPEAGLHEAASVLSGAGIEHRCVQVRGNATEELHRYIRGRSPELVVLGRHGHRAVGEARLGSTVDALVRSIGTNALVAG